MHSWELARRRGVLTRGFEDEKKRPSEDGRTGAGKRDFAEEVAQEMAVRGRRRAGNRMTGKAEYYSAWVSV